MQFLVKLFGTPSCIIDEKKIIFPYRKAEGFFYYLCVKKSVTRDEAISLLWSDYPEHVARKNLRDVLYNLKKFLGENAIVTKGHNHIELSMYHNWDIDLDKITDDNFLECTSLDFLGNFYVKHCAEFDEWVKNVREDLARRALAISEYRIEVLTTNEDSSALINLANILLAKRILNEKLYRKIFRSLIQNNYYKEATLLYKNLSALLKKELGVEPEDQTQILMKQTYSSQQKILIKNNNTEYMQQFFYRKKEIELFINNINNLQNCTHIPALFVTGEAGVGKTEFINHLKKICQSNNYIIINHQCSDGEHIFYLNLLYDIVLQIKDICKNNKISPTFCEFQSDIFKDELLLATDFLYFVKSTIQLILQSLDNGLFFFIDDIQWLDSGSIEFLKNLIFWAKGKRLMIILAGREKPYSINITSLKNFLISKGLLIATELPCFTLEEMRNIISKKAPALLENKYFNDICRKTGGNALFLMELIHEYLHNGNLDTFPIKVDNVLSNNLHRLSHEELDLLAIISIFPQFTTIEDICVLAKQSQIEILNIIKRLVQNRILYTKTTHNKQCYGFSQQLMQKKIYNSMLKDKRIFLHSTIAEYYESLYAKSEDATLCPMLIYHFDACKDEFKTYNYYLEYLRISHAIQREIYPIPKNIGSLPETQIQLTVSCEEHGLMLLAKHIQNLHVQSSKKLLLIMKINFILGRECLFTGNFKKGLEYTRRSIKISNLLEDKVYLLENYLQIVYYAIQINDLNLFHKYISAAGILLKNNVYSDGYICTVMRLKGLYYMLEGLYDQSDAIFYRVIDKFETMCRLDSSYHIGQAACFNYLGETHQNLGNLDAALDLYERAIECSHSCPTVNGIGVFYTNLGYAHYLCNNAEQAQSCINRAISLFDNRDVLWGSAKAYSYAAELALDAGNKSKAETFLERAKQIVDVGKNPQAQSLFVKVKKDTRLY